MGKTFNKNILYKTPKNMQHFLDLKSKIRSIQENL